MESALTFLVGCCRVIGPVQFIVQVNSQVPGCVQGCLCLWHILNSGTRLPWGTGMWSSAAGPSAPRHFTIICPINNCVWLHMKYPDIKLRRRRGAAVPLYVSGSQSVDQLGQIIKRIILINNGGMRGEKYILKEEILMTLSAAILQQQKLYIYLYINMCI